MRPFDRTLIKSNISKCGVDESFLTWNIELNLCSLVVIIFVPLFHFMFLVFITFLSISRTCWDPTHWNRWTYDKKDNGFCWCSFNCQHSFIFLHFCLWICNFHTYRNQLSEYLRWNTLYFAELIKNYIWY